MCYGFHEDESSQDEAGIYFTHADANVASFLRYGFKGAKFESAELTFRKRLFYF